MPLTLSRRQRKLRARQKTEQMQITGKPFMSFPPSMSFPTTFPTPAENSSGHRDDLDLDYPIDLPTELYEYSPLTPEETTDLSRAALLRELPGWEKYPESVPWRMRGKCLTYPVISSLQSLATRFELTCDQAVDLLRIKCAVDSNIRGIRGITLTMIRKVKDELVAKLPGEAEATHETAPLSEPEFRRRSIAGLGPYPVSCIEKIERLRKLPGWHNYQRRFPFGMQPMPNALDTLYVMASTYHLDSHKTVKLLKPLTSGGSQPITRHVIHRAMQVLGRRSAVTAGHSEVDASPFKQYTTRNIGTEHDQDSGETNFQRRKIDRYVPEPIHGTDREPRLIDLESSEPGEEEDLIDLNTAEESLNDTQADDRQAMDAGPTMQPEQNDNDHVLRAQRLATRVRTCIDNKE